MTSGMTKKTCHSVGTAFQIYFLFLNNLKNYVWVF
jgi:hypothetical protein